MQFQRSFVLPLLCSTAVRNRESHPCGDHTSIDLERTKRVSCALGDCRPSSRLENNLHCGAERALISSCTYSAVGSAPAPTYNTWQDYQEDRLIISERRMRIDIVYCSSAERCVLGCCPTRSRPSSGLLLRVRTMQSSPTTHGLQGREDQTHSDRKGFV